MPFGLGFFATVGASAAGGPSFDLLETQNLSGAQSSITFSNLNSNYGSTYQHLQIRAAACLTAGGGIDSMAIRFNGDSGSNYVYHVLQGINSSTPSSSVLTGQTSSRIAFITGNGYATGQFSPIVIDILDPFESGIKNKVARGFSGSSSNGDKGVAIHSALWLNTAAVTSITLLGLSGNIDVNSRISLYGLKAV